MGYINSFSGGIVITICVHLGASEHRINKLNKTLSDSAEICLCFESNMYISMVCGGLLLSIITEGLFPDHRLRNISYGDDVNNLIQCITDSLLPCWITRVDFYCISGDREKQRRVFWFASLFSIPSDGCPLSTVAITLNSRIKYFK